MSNLEDKNGRKEKSVIPMDEEKTNHLVHAVPPTQKNAFPGSSFFQRTFPVFVPCGAICEEQR